MSEKTVKTPLSPPLPASLLFADVKLLMHSYGDVGSPLQSSVELVLSILKQQTHSLLCHLADVSNLKDSNSITHEEILFLFRKNRVKLQRLLNHIKTKELRSSISRDIDIVESNSAELPKSKRLKTCEQYLNQIETTGRLQSAIQSNEIDMTRQKRLLRQDLVTRTMSEEEYMRYHEARQVNLSKKLKIAAVREYLFRDIETQYKISSSALDLIAFCMHDVIAEIIDLSLMLKIESKQSTDPVERLNPHQHPVCSDWLTQRIMLTTDLSAFSMISSLHAAHTTPTHEDSMSDLNAITPKEIREAVRRRTERVSILHPKAKGRSHIVALHELMCL